MTHQAHDDGRNRSDQDASDDRFQTSTAIGESLDKLSFDGLLDCRTEVLVGEIFSKFRPNEEIKALEIGCGPGATTSLLMGGIPNLYAGHPNARLLAFDLNDAQVKKAQAKLGNTAFGRRIDFQVGDALELLSSQNSESFDAVASGFTIHNFHQQYRHDVLCQIHRVLRSGGIFINGDKYAQDDPVKHTEALAWMWEKFAKLNAGNAQAQLEWELHNQDDETPERKMSESESLRAMKEIGFKDPTILFREFTEAVLVAYKP